MTDWVRDVAAMARGREGGAGEIGARVYPTLEANEAAGLDVTTWLNERLVDFVVPMVYGHNVVDADMPIEWLLEAAHRNEIAVYPMVSPYHTDDSRVRMGRQHATPEMMRAAAASYWDRGSDGMYTWFLDWPLGDTERSILTELGDADLAMQGNKHYVVRRTSNYMELHGIDCPLPLQMEANDTGVRRAIPFYVADDCEAEADRIARVALRVNIKDIVFADRLSFHLNGESLSGEKLTRSPADGIAPYVGQWLEFDLSGVRPRKGGNTLEITLEGRANGIVSPLVVEDVEIVVDRTFYPPRLL